MALAVSGANADVNVNVCCSWRGVVGMILRVSGVWINVEAVCFSSWQLVL